MSAFTIFTRLYRAEWLKLRYQPLALLLLAFFLLLLVLQMSLQFLVVALARGLLGGVMVEILPLPQITQYQLGISLPGCFGTALGHTNGLGGIFAIILAAGSLGNEFAWGTLRMLLARQPARGLVIVAKAAALMTGFALAIVAALVLATCLSLIFASILSLPISLGLLPLLNLPMALLRALLVLLPYVLLTLMFTVVGRSTLIGVAGGLVYLSFEVGLGSLTLNQLIGGFWELLYNLTIGQNINTLVVANSRSFGLDSQQLSRLDLSTLPSVPQAILVILVYSASFLLATIQLMRRRELRGPG